MDTSARRINALVAANGAFSIDGVPAGSYVLSFQQCPVRGADCVGGPRGGNTSVTVTNQDVVNLNINFANRSVAIPAPCPPALANRNPALCGPQIGVVGLTPAPAVITPPAVAPSGRPTLLETRLGMIPRAPLTTAKDCGHVPTEKAQTVIACVDEALRAKSPFVASFEQKGIDSIVVIGLGGTAPEGVVQVLFDSNSGAGSGRVSAPRECNGPKLTVAGEAVQVTCQ
jgi:hypothetical protein